MPLNLVIHFLSRKLWGIKSLEEVSLKKPFLNTSVGQHERVYILLSLLCQYLYLLRGKQLSHEVVSQKELLINWAMKVILCNCVCYMKNMLPVSSIASLFL